MKLNRNTLQIASVEENKKCLVEMGLCKEGDELKYCKSSKCGDYKCAVKTRVENIFCDLCLEEELLSLWYLGIHPTASCCGHGDASIASIVVETENSVQKMKELGYEKLEWEYENERQAMFKPKTKMLYECDQSKK